MIKACFISLYSYCPSIDRGVLGVENNSDVDSWSDGSLSTDVSINDDSLLQRRYSKRRKCSTEKSRRRRLPRTSHISSVHPSLVSDIYLFLFFFLIAPSSNLFRLHYVAIKCRHRIKVFIRYTSLLGTSLVNGTSRTTFNNYRSMSPFCSDTHYWKSYYYVT